MATKNDFSADEWNTLRDTPHLVGLAVALAGASGITGTIREVMSAGQAMLEAAQSGDPLVQSLAAREEVQAGAAAIRQRVGEGDLGQLQQRVTTAALDAARAAMALLGTKGTPAEREAYRTFLRAVADHVAKASKEGAFLGIFGGEQVSAPEQKFLVDLTAAIGA